MSTVASQIKARAAALRPADKLVVWTVLGLAALGVVAVYSAISFLAETKSGGDTESFLFRHLIRTGLALSAVGVVSLLDYRRLARASKWFLIGALGLLAAVQVGGIVLGGAQRWLEIGGVSFQPSDFAKVALILHVAVLLARKQAYIEEFERGFVPLMIWTVPTIALIGLDDLSTAAILSMAVGAMMVIGRVRMLHLGGVAAVGMLAATLFLMASPNRAARVEAYLGVKLFDHTEEAAVFSSQDEGYQANQARIAIAMGGLTGVGPGKSVQRDFLPAPYNDFIFAIVAEEYGLVGAGLLLFAFVIVLVRGFLRIARQAPDPLGLFLAVGVTATLVLYGFVNAGVASGLLPVTGLPMPFVSYGGTSLLATGVMAGLLLNVSRHADPSQR
ncbi:MAG: putative peptidoglycan glycosyltransferase FtsW [Rhodothermales bacterium]